MFFGIDVYYTARNSKTTSMFCDPVSTPYKVLIHNIDTGYVIENSQNKKTVSYRLDNGKWIKQCFWDTELKIIKGTGDTLEITNVSPNKL